MICVVATITTKAEQRESFLRAFRELMPLVHAEDGCIEYFPTIDVDSGLDVQADVEERVVTVIEKWESLDALQAHLDAAHMHAFRERVADIVERLTLQVLQPA